MVFCVGLCGYLCGCRLPLGLCFTVCVNGLGFGVMKHMLWVMYVLGRLLHSWFLIVF